MNNKEKVTGHLIYKGPSVDEGIIDILKLSDSLKSFYIVFNEVKKELDIKEELILRAGDIKKGSSDIVIYINLLENIAKSAMPLATIIAVSKVADYWGVTEITKPIFKGIGDLIKAKSFTKNEKYEITNDCKVNTNTGRIIIGVKNLENKIEHFDQRIFLLSQKLKTLEKLAPISKNNIEEVYIKYDTKDEENIIARIDNKNYPYLKYNPEVQQAEDKIRARIRSVDNKTGNGKLWVDEDKKESCNFEIEIKEIAKLEKVISNLAMAESKNATVFITGNKEFENGKLVKVYISDIDLDNTLFDYFDSDN